MKFFIGKTGFRSLGLLAMALMLATLSGLTGCSMGTIQLSGAEPNTTAKITISGKVHGGQNPVSNSAVQLWVAGTTGYGTGATQLLSYSSPGVPCVANITGFSITSNIATLTAANAFTPGITVLITGLTTGTYLIGNFTVLSATSTSFTVALVHANVATTADSGTAQNTGTCSESVNSAADGSFSITGDYTCPSASSQIYITATGGNPGLLPTSTNNTAIKLAAVVGTCGNLVANAANNYIIINEVTTVGAAFAFGQYFDLVNETFGAPSTTQAQAGFNNAYSTYNNLVINSSGLANTGVTLTGSGGTITTTPEVSKLYTIANILASCIATASSSSSNCSTLLSDVPPNGTTITDTLQAAVGMSRYPTSGSPSNITTLFNLASSTGSPFVGPSGTILTTAPTDWTLGILYTGTSTNIPNALDVKVDSLGNVWVLSNSTGALTELGPDGTPLFTASTFGALSISAANPRNMAIDTSNNVFIASSSSPYTEVKYVPGTANTAATTIALNKSPYGIAIDGNNNVFFGLQSSSATFDLYEFTGGNLATSNEITYPLIGGSTATLAPEYMVFDTSGNLWMTNGTSSTVAGYASLGYVEQLTASSISTGTAGCSVFPCTVSSATYNQFTGGSPSEPYALAAGNGTMWYANYGNSAGTSVTNLSNTGTNATSYGTSASFNVPRYAAVDGAGNVWFANKLGPTSATTGATIGTSVTELSSSGTLLSPTSSNPTLLDPGYVHSGLNGGAGIAIDPSGNVWVANNVSSAPNLNSVFEIVGAAVPAVTPLSLALNLGKVAAKP